MIKVVAYFRKMIQVQPLTTANSTRQGATLTASTTKQHSRSTPHRSDCHIRVHSPNNTSNAPHRQHAFPWRTHSEILMQAGESSGKRNAPRPRELATVLMWLDCPLSRQQWALRSKIWVLQASISGLWGIDPGGCRQPVQCVRRCYQYLSWTRLGLGGSAGALLISSCSCYCTDWLHATTGTKTTAKTLLPELSQTVHNNSGSGINLFNGTLKVLKALRLSGVDWQTISLSLSLSLSLPLIFPVCKLQLHAAALKYVCVYICIYINV